MPNTIDPVMLAFLEGKNALKHVAQHLYHMDGCENLFNSITEVLKNICIIEDIYVILSYGEKKRSADDGT